MTITTRIRAVAGLGFACTVSSIAAADDIAPPWWRGWELTVYTEWEFANTPSDWTFMPPDSTAAVGGYDEPFFDGFTTHAEVDLESNWMWTSADGDGGITPATGVPVAGIGFRIANWVDDMLAKTLRVQVTWSGQIPPDVFALTGYKEGYSYPREGQIISGPNTFDDSHFAIDWLIFGWNPDWELLEVSVPQGTVLDEVIIDTWSYFPSPGTGALFALAFVGGSRRVRTPFASG